MSLIHYEPWSLLNQLQKELLESRYANKKIDESMVGTSQWPAVDFKEEGNRFVLYADVPGINPEAIEISTEGSVLTIRGERESERKEDNKDYSRIERIYGKFYRMFTLPDTADCEHITARSNHGVLEIEIPKKEQAKPRKINVNVTQESNKKLK